MCKLHKIAKLNKITFHYVANIIFLNYYSLNIVLAIWKNKKKKQFSHELNIIIDKTGGVKIGGVVGRFVEEKNITLSIDDSSSRA